MCRRDPSTPDAPSALDPDRLVRRLRELAGEERDVQVDFLLHLDEFDRRRAFLEEGHDSLWTYCQSVLRLREGAAGRRIGAMRVLRRFPELEAPLRDGRLCLSTVTLIGPLLTPDNLPDLVARASNRTKAEVERLVVSIQPRVAPKEGLRKLPQRETDAAANGKPGPESTILFRPPERSAPASVNPAPLDAASAPSAEEAGAPPIEWHVSAATGGAGTSTAAPFPSPAPLHAIPTNSDPGSPHSFPGFTLSLPCSTPPPAPTRRHELRPTSADAWSLRVTLDDRAKADLETLSMLLSHSTGGDLAAVLREAIRCGIEKHGKRKGAVAPTRDRARSRSSADAPAEAPAAVTSGGSDTTTACEPKASATPFEAATPLSAAASLAAGTPLGAATRPLASKASAVPRTDRGTPGSGPATTHDAPPSRDRSDALRADRRAIPIAVRREVWLRDGGCCAWTSPDGRRCGSRWKLEFDHVRPVAQGGPSTVDNLRLACRTHNMLHAELVFGREHMARFASAGADRARHAGPYRAQHAGTGTRPFVERYSQE